MMIDRKKGNPDPNYLCPKQTDPNPHERLPCRPFVV